MDISSLSKKWCVAAFLLHASLSPEAATFFVNDNTSSEYVGCSTAAHSTVSAAVSAARGSNATPHTINVCPGTYSELGLIDTNSNRLANLVITGLASPADPTEVIIQGNTAPTATNVFRIRRSGITIQNLTINLGNHSILVESQGSSFSLIDVDLNDQDDDCIVVGGNSSSLTRATIDGCGARGIEYDVNNGSVSLSEITVSNTGQEGIYLNRLTSGTVSDITITDSSSNGLSLEDTSNVTFNVSTLTENSISGSTASGITLDNTSDTNSFADYSVTSNLDGAVLDGASSNTFDNSDFSSNTTDGIRLIGSADSNIFTSNTFTNNGDDGLEILLGDSNSLTTSQVESNSGTGIEISGGSTLNIIDGNLFFENTVNGANIAGTGSNSFYDNCSRNVANISDTSTGTTTYTNLGSGNFWGSIPAGTGFSETCMDAGSTSTVQTDDDICDSPFVDGGTTDTAPLQICDAFFTTHNMILSKTALTFSDPVNGLASGGNNPKAIPGATVLYTITATNQATDNRIGTATDITITDDFTSQITGGTLSWNANMVISSPDAGTSVPLLDPEDGDAGEFLSNLITAQCGDLNAGQSCTFTFSLDVQ